MRKITVERLAEFTERDYQLAFGISKDEFDQMLAALEEAYAREHKRKPRFTKITIKDKLILTLIYRHEYRSRTALPTSTKFPAIPSQIMSTGWSRRC